MLRKDYAKPTRLARAQLPSPFENPVLKLVEARRDTDLGFRTIHSAYFTMYLENIRKKRHLWC